MKALVGLYLHSSHWQRPLSLPLSYGLFFLLWHGPSLTYPGFCATSFLLAASHRHTVNHWNTAVLSRWPTLFSFLFSCIYTLSMVPGCMGMSQTRSDKYASSRGRQMARLIVALFFAGFAFFGVIALRGLRNGKILPPNKITSVKVKVLTVTYISGVSIFLFMSLVNFIVFFFDES